MVFAPKEKSGNDWDLGERSQEVEPDFGARRVRVGIGLAVVLSV